ncbi:hypothetical protein K7X08_013592 [Anisodus acutangulus]|uniref:AP2/ERF domain-containing protein n=1 Tax=Anisodus acutangulus TaxID=402998 RepID=A0A9Q1LKE6_9SOLA|nr:hypothetical protein K7X08_013592 [Anisodus acutangulus]
MCGGAIISDLIPPPRTSRRLTAECLWGCSNLKNNNKKNIFNYHSKPLRSEVVDYDFQDCSHDDDVKPFAFFASELSGALAGSKSLKSVDLNNEVEKSSKRKRKNQYRGIRQRPWEEAAGAYDVEAWRIRGKKAKVNFPDEAPVPASRQAGKAFSKRKQKICMVMKICAPLLERWDLPTHMPLQLLPAGVYFNSDQGSNSFDPSDFGWGETCSRTPEISSVLSAATESDEAQFFEGADPPEEKPKSCSNNLVPYDANTVHKPSEELSDFESQMKFFQNPYSEGNLDASVDAFLNADATQGGENAMDLWSFDDLSSLMGVSSVGNNITSSSHDDEAHSALENLSNDHPEDLTPGDVVGNTETVIDPAADENGSAPDRDGVVEGQPTQDAPVV